MSLMRIGIDLGGTKIEAIALNSEGIELSRIRKPTPQGDYPATLKLIHSLIQETENNIQAMGSIGIGTPGSISPLTGKIRNANSTCLNNQTLDKDLSSLLQRPIKIANDADCFALSEAIDGAGQMANSVFGVILGTGVGGGIVINKQLLNGANSITGEWGHNGLSRPLISEVPGPDCYCGRQGCIETFLSGPAFEKAYFELTKEKRSAAEIINKSEDGDNMANQIVQQYEDRLARSLANVINILDPEVIVLGGGMSNISRLYQNIPKIWDQYIFSDVINTKLRPPQYGDSSGVRGAAWL